MPHNFGCFGHFILILVILIQSCLTLCDPMDNSPGQNIGVGSLSLLQGIFPTQGLSPGLQHCRRILYQLNHKESPRYMLLLLLLLSHFSCVQLSATPWTAAYQAPPPMGFFRQEYWSGVPLPSTCQMSYYLPFPFLCGH